MNPQLFAFTFVAFVATNDTFDLFIWNELFYFLSACSINKLIVPLFIRNAKKGDEMFSSF